jgi:hypothetical protein
MDDRPCPECGAVVLSRPVQEQCPHCPRGWARDSASVTALEFMSSKQRLQSLQVTHEDRAGEEVWAIMGLLWLECEMSPIGSCLTGWSQLATLCWEVVESLGGRALLEEVDHWGLAFASCLIPGPFLPLSLSLLPSCDEMRNFVQQCFSAMKLCLTTGPQCWAQATIDRNL